ncbi:hypothetical protein OS493_033388 [Desmophyllum pertusum]|uniref:Uncharacterized protein n=1 Tax=Desmophyllum pertusum TaxID=174260 RepID=A0A9X0CIC9_9CNID|nr:hypothetical protein OS493_033388 [Desmophyllum pertusum]
MSNQDQSDLQQLRSNAADTAQTLRFKRGHPVSPAFTCTSKGDENVTVVRKKKGQRLVFDPSPLEPCQIQPPLSADHYPQVLCLPLSSNSDDCVPQLDSQVHVPTVVFPTLPPNPKTNTAKYVILGRAFFG